MKNFHRDGKSGGKGDRDSRRSTMYQAVCATCGQKCEVPFRPTGDRPVYCSSCFEKSGGGSFSRPGNKRFDRPSFGDRPKFQATCATCGKKCEVPFRPTGEKPIYCNDCFDKGGAAKVRQPDSSGSQLAQINAKLDRLIAALLPAPVKPAPEKKADVPSNGKIVQEEIKLKKEKKAAGKAKPADKKKAVKKKK